MSKDSVAMADQIRVLSKTRLLNMRGKVSIEVMTQLEKALLIAMDLPGQDEC